MTPEDYRRAGDLFDRLRDLPEGERAAVLDSSCGDNAGLRAQVVRLLEADRNAGSGLVVRRAIEDAARLLISEGPKLPAPGTVIGKYSLGSLIGAGGMGVVFEGQDLNLHRRVAIKVLPLPAAAGGAHGIQRFHREARAVSLLNHPNIVSIFDADFDQGFYYIAMEFVEGKTLRQLISSESDRLDAKTILDLIGQTASALNAAHEAGIVHRDIKPENIMVRADGLVKVLDFGLAKLIEPSSGPKNEPTDLRTRPEHVVGTIRYLSPEQVTGKPVGPRSDLFSVGVVAYELATGIRPFDGPTDGAVFDAILNRTPAPPSTLRPALGNELDGLILQALEKDPDLRFQTASGLRSTCKRLSRDSGRSNTVPFPSGRPRRYGFWIAALVAAMGLAAYAWYLFGPRTPAPAEQMRITQITHTGLASHPAISPDGSYIAFVNGEPGASSIRLRELAADTEIEVLPSGAAVIHDLAFSSDGHHLYFVRIQGRPEENGLFEMPVLGGAPKRISDAANREVALSHNGRFAVLHRLQENDVGENLTVLDLATGESRLLSTRLKPEYFTGTQAWSVDDRYIAAGICSGNPCGLGVIDAASGAVRKIGAQDYNGIGGLAWLPGRRRLAALIAAANSVYQVFLLDYPSGRTRRVTNDLNSYIGLSLSADGGTLATTLRQRSANIWIADWHAGHVGEQVQVTFGREGVYDGASGLAWANENEITYSTPDSVGWNLHLLKPGGKSRPITTGRGYNALEVVCPDGRSVVYESDRFDEFNLWRTDLVTGRTGRLTNGREIDGSPSCTPDSRAVIYGSLRGGQDRIWKVGLDGSAPVQVSQLEALAPSLSPDGKWIAGLNAMSDYSTRILLLDAATGTLVWSLPFPGDGHVQSGLVRWTPDGSGIMYCFRRAAIGNLWLQPRAGGPPRQVTNFRSGLVWNFAFSPDGRRLALSRGSDTGDIVLIRGFLER